MTITNIKVPPQWVSTDDFNSHREMLYLALQNTTGSVCELGMGYGSTLLLEDYCKDRTFISCETNYDWYERIKENKEKWNGVLNVLSSYAEVPVLDFGLLFVDLAPALLRAPVIEKFKDAAKVIVVHDSEITSDFAYGMRNILSQFKYRLDYHPIGNPSTTVVSNFVDVTKWKGCD
jgi:hypothetical protein